MQPQKYFYVYNGNRAKGLDLRYKIDTQCKCEQKAIKEKSPKRKLRPGSTW